MDMDFHVADSDQLTGWLDLGLRGGTRLGTH